MLVANETEFSMLKSNACGVTCKLDIEKIYNYVNWNLFLAVLEQMDFQCKIDRLDYYISSAFWYLLMAHF